MGSRAIAVVCRDPEVVASGASASTGLGALYTRTGRPFLDDGDRALERIRDAATKADLWETAGDELARARLRAAAVVGEGDGADPAPVRGGRRGRPTRRSAPPPRVLETAAARGLDVGDLLDGHARSRTPA